MSSLNSITLSGDISTAAGEPKEFGDTKVAEATLTYSVRGKDGDKEQWVDIEAWGEQADALVRLVAGSEVVIQGTLRRQAWQTNGEWKSKHVVRVAALHNLGRGIAQSELPADTEGLKNDNSNTDDSEVPF